uniref:Aminoglycoside phosphotransferase domain-containing protein n=1 Tax=viral metagenome TaxID=1070528 RepID=A0A6C0H559_9ZZZZ
MNIDNYGFTFNNITINDNIFKKDCKNLIGKQKINNEINFYLYIINNNIDFSIPKLLDHKDGSLSIEYIQNSCTLTNKIDTANSYEYITKIKQKLSIIHNIKIQVSLDVIRRDLNIEVYKKVLDRFDEFDWKSNILYNSIKNVNGLKIRDINYYCNIIRTKIINYVKNREYYSIIHGDTHLGNILLDKNDKLFFIDPRGHFGETKLFGLYEYDYAKLLFGLSGYSVFDNMIINELKINNNNIEIDFIKNYEYIFKTDNFDKLTILFCLSIWLGNNSCFSNINKKITSIMIAYYYCEKYIEYC